MIIMRTIPNEEALSITVLTDKIAFLEEENKRLNETVEWMHNLIWDMYKRMRNAASKHTT